MQNENRQGPDSIPLRGISILKPYDGFSIAWSVGDTQLASELCYTTS